MESLPTLCKEQLNQDSYTLAVNDARYGGILRDAGVLTDTQRDASTEFTQQFFNNHAQELGLNINSINTAINFYLEAVGENATADTKAHAIIQAEVTELMRQIENSPKRRNGQLKAEALVMLYNMYGVSAQMIQIPNEMARYDATIPRGGDYPTGHRNPMANGQISEDGKQMGFWYLVEAKVSNQIDPNTGLYGKITEVDGQEKFVHGEGAKIMMVPHHDQISGAQPHKDVPLVVEEEIVDGQPMKVLKGPTLQDDSALVGSSFANMVYAAKQLRDGVKFEGDITVLHTDGEEINSQWLTYLEWVNKPRWYDQAPAIKQEKREDEASKAEDIILEQTNLGISGVDRYRGQDAVIAGEASEQPDMRKMKFVDSDGNITDLDIHPGFEVNQVNRGKSIAELKTENAHSVYENSQQLVHRLREACAALFSIESVMAERGWPYHKLMSTVLIPTCIEVVDQGDGNTDVYVFEENRTGYNIGAEETIDRLEKYLQDLSKDFADFFSNSKSPEQDKNRYNQVMNRMQEIGNETDWSDSQFTIIEEDSEEISLSVQLPFTTRHPGNYNPAEHMANMQGIERALAVMPQALQSQLKTLISGDRQKPNTVPNTFTLKFDKSTDRTLISKFEQAFKSQVKVEEQAEVTEAPRIALDLVSDPQVRPRESVGKIPDMFHLHYLHLQNLAAQYKELSKSGITLTPAEVQLVDIMLDEVNPNADKNRVNYVLTKIVPFPAMTDAARLLQLQFQSILKRTRASRTRDALYNQKAGVGPLDHILENGESRPLQAIVTMGPGHFGDLHNPKEKLTAQQVRASILRTPCIAMLIHELNRLKQEKSSVYKYVV